MQMMVRSISLILTTITVALLLVFGSITIKAESPYTYTYYVTLANGTNQVWKSDQEITLGTATGSYYYDPNTGMYIERASATRNVYRCSLTANACILSWDGQEWIISLPVISCNANVDTMYHTVFCYNAITSVTSTKPSNFPEYSDKSFTDIVGDIADQKISTALQQAESELSQSIIDQTQAIIDKLGGVDNETYSIYQLQDALMGVLNSYQQLDDPTALDDQFPTLLGEIQYTLHLLKSDMDKLSVSEVLVLNNVYEMTTNLIGQISQNKRNEHYWDERDIESSVSESIKQSDQEEIDYLEDLIDETSKSISELSPSDNFTPQQIQTATAIVDGIWENDIIKKLIPLAACFMVVCVVLGVKYRL